MGFDWDDILAYTTARKVRLRHRYVGGLYYLTMIGILCYTILVQVVVQQGYLLLQPVAGSVRATVMAAKHPTPVAQLGYCQSEPGSGTTDQDVESNALQSPCISLQPLVDTQSTPNIGLLVGTRVSSAIQVSG